MTTFFDPDRRLRALLADSRSPEACVEEICGAVEHSDKVPGVYLDEDDLIEARWGLWGKGAMHILILNVTFGDEIELYVYDRAISDIIATAKRPYSPENPGSWLGGVVAALRAPDPGTALLEALEA